MGLAGYISVGEIEEEILRDTRAGWEVV